MADVDVVTDDPDVATEASGVYSPYRAYLDNLRVFVLALIVAMLLGGAALLLIFGASPLAAYRTILDSSFGSLAALGLTLNKTVPLLLGSAAVAFGMRAGYLNLGVDGQIYVGAIFATGVALFAPDLPMVATIPLVVVAGALGGATFGFIPGILRQRWGVNELFVTVMLNFVGFYLVDWLATGPWTDPIAGEALTLPIAATWRLPTLFHSAHVGVLLAVVVAVALTWWLNRTRSGFAYRAVGINPAAARIGGVNLFRTGLLALVVGGAVAGIAGGLEVSGVHGRMISGFSPNYGYMSVLAAVLARKSPVLTIPVAFGFGVLLVGSDALQRTIGLPSAAVLLLQALVVLSVLFFEARGSGRPWRSIVPRRAQ